MIPCMRSSAEDRQATSGPRRAEHVVKHVALPRFAVAPMIVELVEADLEAGGVELFVERGRAREPARLAVPVHPDIGPVEGKPLPVPDRPLTLDAESEEGRAAA